MSTVSGVSGVEAGAPAHKRKGSIEHEGGPPLQHVAPHDQLHLTLVHPCTLQHLTQVLLEPWLSVCTRVATVKARLCVFSLRYQKVCGMAVTERWGCMCRYANQAGVWAQPLWNLQEAVPVRAFQAPAARPGEHCPRQRQHIARQE